MQSETIVLDANLLVLLIVGSVSRSYIAKHRRLKAYTAADYTLLVGLVKSAAEVIATPNTLTEASNLVGYISEPARTQIYQKFRVLANEMAERYIDSRRAVKQEEFLRLGLTDSVLLKAGEEKLTLLTADVDLYLAAASHGFKVVNFNHHRAM